MDILSELNVENVMKTSNRALFLTRFGGPITFHLQVGRGEERLLKAIRQTVHAFGGRYFKRYHEMTPYTVLLVTDLGFKAETFNRPAICVTYIGDCVHTNNLRNINEYIHPWDNLERWKQVNLFDVIYSHSRMFQCASISAPNCLYVPVSRSSKGDGVCQQKPSTLGQSDCSELLVVSDDDDLFFRKCNSAKSNSDTKLDSRTVRQSLNEVTEEPKEGAENLDKPQQEAATCEDTNFVNERRPVDDGRPDKLLPPDRSDETVVPPQSCKTKCAGDSSSKCTPLSLTESGKSLKDLQGETSECEEFVAQRNPYVLLSRIPERLIRNKAVVSGKDNLKVADMMSTSRVLQAERLVALENRGIPKIAKKNLSRQCDDRSLQVDSPFVKNVDKPRETGNIEDGLVERLPVESLGEIPNKSLLLPDQENNVTEKNSLESHQGTKTPKEVKNSRAIKVASVFRLSPKHKRTLRSASNKSSLASAGEQHVEIKRRLRNAVMKSGKIGEVGENKAVMKKSNVGCSTSDVECVPAETPVVDLIQESCLSPQQKVAEGQPPCSSRSAPSLVLTSPKVEFQKVAGEQPPCSSRSAPSLVLTSPKVEFQEENVLKRRGRGYQDRYRRCEKVAMLKWLVLHRKFRNLRGVLVWREMERKKVVPGRSHQSLKNQFLKHLVKALDAYPFLTDDEKRKFRGEDPVTSTDEDEGFFYHGQARS